MFSFFYIRRNYSYTNFVSHVNYSFVSFDLNSIIISGHKENAKFKRICYDFVSKM